MTMVSSFTPWKHHKTSGFWEAATAYLKFCKIYSKTPVPDSLLLKKRFWHKCFSMNFEKFLRKPFWPATLLKKGLWLRCFPVSFAKFLREPFLQNTSERLLLLVSLIFQGSIYNGRLLLVNMVYTSCLTSRRTT